MGDIDWEKLSDGVWMDEFRGASSDLFASTIEVAFDIMAYRGVRWVGWNKYGLMGVSRYPLFTFKGEEVGCWRKGYLYTSPSDESLPQTYFEKNNDEDECKIFLLNTKFDHILPTICGMTFDIRTKEDIQMLCQFLSSLEKL